jgi:long-chain acyl-CoA synthetase
MLLPFLGRASNHRSSSPFLRIPYLRRKVRTKILDGLGLSDAGLVAAGGAATPVGIIEWYRALGVNFVEGYGMSETGITHVPLPGQSRLGYVGTSSPYTVTRISDAGEIQTKGPMSMLGYFQEPALTHAAFTEDGFFRTGDRGEIDEDGRLRITGRLKEEFKTSKGKYVAPSQIESLLSLSSLFESVAVFGAGMTGPFAIAVLVSTKRRDAEDASKRPALEAELGKILEATNAQLEPHERIRFIVIAHAPWTPENGPLTPTLKVRRALIEERQSSHFQAWENSGKPTLWIEML